MKSRGVYETPGGTILHVAHQGLESLTLDRSTMEFKAHAAVKYAQLVYDGSGTPHSRKPSTLSSTRPRKPAPAKCA